MLHCRAEIAQTLCFRAARLDLEAFLEARKLELGRLQLEQVVRPLGYCILVMIQAIFRLLLPFEQASTGFEASSSDRPVISDLATGLLEARCRLR